MPDKPVPSYSYDVEGKSYTTGRRTDPRIAAQLWQYLDNQQSLLNIGAGAGSYEPDNANLVALEPSATMLAQRSGPGGNIVQAMAEPLPFADKSFDQVMTVLSMHHWPQQQNAFNEIQRVCRHRFIALTWDPECEPFWLTRDYFPELYSMDQAIFPKMDELRDAFPGVEIKTVPIPWDCEDGFSAAYWRRPEAYLDPAVRACMSTFARLADVDTGLGRLQNDLRDGSWEERNQTLAAMTEYDAGYRLIVATLND